MLLVVLGDVLAVFGVCFGVSGDLVSAEGWIGLKDDSSRMGVCLRQQG